MRLLYLHIYMCIHSCVCVCMCVCVCVCVCMHSLCRWQRGYSGEEQRILFLQILFLLIPVAKRAPLIVTKKCRDMSAPGTEFQTSVP